MSRGGPLVSCLIATGGRPELLAQAVRCFRRQTHRERELVIVDDTPGGPAVDHSSADARIAHIASATPLGLGAKLNLAASMSSGEIVQKLDDDDYYHPDFVATLAGALRASGDPHAVAGLECFLVYVAGTGELCHSGHGWFAGGTLCFGRDLWNEVPFRDVHRAVDWHFTHDHPGRRVPVCQPELYVVVRHGYGHTWRQMGGVGVSDYFRRRPPWPGGLDALMPPPDAAFYRRLAGDGARG